MNANNKKIVKLNGGLGNQMFQYAFGLVLAENFQSQIVFDFSWFDEVKTQTGVVQRCYELDVFDLECKRASKQALEKICREKPSKNVITQSSAYVFDKKFIKADKYYYDGYFQNENYFKHIRTRLIQDFSLKGNLDEKNVEMLNKIKESNSISVHIRRGDYVTLASANKFHGTCSLEYYAKAIEYISEKVGEPHFFLFSDDIPWVLENLKIDYPYTVVDINGCEKAYCDIELMKNCKHNIIANSSFSWWGAWLNENPKKIVIAPKHWTAQRVKCDIVPKGWKKI